MISISIFLIYASVKSYHGCPGGWKWSAIQWQEQVHDKKKRDIGTQTLHNSHETSISDNKAPSTKHQKTVQRSQPIYNFCQIVGHTHNNFRKASRLCLACKVANRRLENCLCKGTHEGLDSTHIRTTTLSPVRPTTEAHSTISSTTATWTY